MPHPVWNCTQPSLHQATCLQSSDVTAPVWPGGHCSLLPGAAAIAAEVEVAEVAEMEGRGGGGGGGGGGGLVPPDGQAPQDLEHTGSM